MKRIIDLTHPIQEHWRINFKSEIVSHWSEEHKWQKTGYYLESQWGTHIDFPVHHALGAPDSNDFPIEDWAFSTALVLDFSNIGDEVGITSEMLEKANEPFKDRHFNTLLIRTDRPKHVSYDSYEYWDTSPWVTEDGGQWLLDYKPKVVGFDFPQDYEIRKLRHLPPGTDTYQPVHDLVLIKGNILMIEYMTNLWEIKSPICEFVSLPLNTQHTDGSQVRCVAIVED